jgi:hypothetical protein
VVAAKAMARARARGNLLHRARGSHKDSLHRRDRVSLRGSLRRRGKGSHRDGLHRKDKVSLKDNLHPRDSRPSRRRRTQGVAHRPQVRNPVHPRMLRRRRMVSRRPGK